MMTVLDQDFLNIDSELDLFLALVRYAEKHDHGKLICNFEHSNQFGFKRKMFNFIVFYILLFQLRKKKRLKLTSKPVKGRRIRKIYRYFGMKTNRQPFAMQ